MKLLLALVLLGLCTSALAAPRPQPRTTSIVLQDGTHAVIKNGQLLLIGSDGKQTAAPPGRYVTRDGKQLTVESNGRLSSSESPPNPPQRRNEPAASVTPTRTDPAKAPNPAPIRPDPAAVPSVAPTRPDTTRALTHPEAANDMANATKTQDAVLKALYEITTKLQAMESKQAAQLQAIEVKQTALENEMKALHVTTTQMPGMKSEILKTQADILSLLKGINEKTELLPPKLWKNDPAFTKDATYWAELIDRVAKTQFKN